MRPLQLTMQAFGPYINKTTIDFEAFGTGSVYLITGDTGSGKTMIFDSIVFALYGTASGEGRSIDLLRSRSASPDEPTYVELLFEYHSKKYLVRRNPEYFRKSKRGDGETKEKATAELHFFDGRPSISGLSEVNSQLENIIGINKDQFTQIAMIAQGDFLKILRSDTKERIEIFSRIFNTKNYRALQEKLKNDYAEYDAEVKKLRDKILQDCENIYPPQSEPLQTKYNKWLNLKNVDDISEIVELIDIAVKEYTESLKNNEDINKIKDKELQNLNEKIGKLENLLTLKNDLVKLKEEYAKNTEANLILQKSYEAKKQLIPENDIKKQQIEKIQNLYPQYDEFEQSKQKYSENSKALIDTDSALAKEKANVEKLENEIKGFNDELIKLKDVDVELVKIQHSMDQINKKNEEYIELNKKYQSYRALREELKYATEKAEKAISTYQLKSEEYSTKNSEFLKNQAGILAQSLAPGKNCPVCGSTEHPSPAKLTGVTLSKDELDKLKKQSLDAEKLANEASQKSKELSGSAKIYSDTLMPQIQNIFGSTANFKVDSFKIKIEENEKELSNLNIKANYYKGKINNKKDIELELPKKQDALKNSQNNITKLIQQKTTLDTNIANIIANLSKLNSLLPYPDKLQANKVVDSLKFETLNFEKDLDTLKNKCDEQTKYLSEQKGKIDSLEKQTSNVQLEDINTLKYDREQIRGGILKLNETISNQKLIIKNNTTIKERIVKDHSSYSKVYKKYLYINDLNNTANGKVAGKRKIMLEAYVQMSYFDRIIAKANIRLLEMSNMQYELMRRDDDGSRVSQVGLDLDVIDHYNNSVRSVNSLSGGESFKASLSLALGLSDVIQQSSGGIKLDTMFVDEGFGTLDDNSLNQAIKTLVGLTQGNRTIGIISHVNELKERFDKKINVIKDRQSGSRVELIL